MVNVITKKCSVTGKIIMGVGQDEFDKNWKAHLETLNVKKVIVKKPVIKEIKEEEIKEPIIEEKKIVDFKETAIKSNLIDKIKTLVENTKNEKNTIIE